MDKLFSALAQLARDCGAQRLTLFGSRARGDNHERSDIDLAVYGMPEAEQIRFLSGIDVFIDPYTSPDLLSEIDRDGVILYENQAR